MLQPNGALCTKSENISNRDGSKPIQLGCRQRSPPLPKMISPVSQRASSDARKAAINPMSSGMPVRPSGVMALIPVATCSYVSIALAPSGIDDPWIDRVHTDISCSKLLGQDAGNAIQRTLSCRVNGRSRRSQRTLATEPILMMLPPFPPNFCAARLEVRRSPRTLVSNCRRNSASLTSCNGRQANTPALLRNVNWSKLFLSLVEEAIDLC